MNFRLLEIVTENLPNFNPEENADLIKAEKILKSLQKTGADPSQNDIDEFLEFYRNGGNRFQDFFADENIRRILSGEDCEINPSKNKINSLDENLQHGFAEEFEQAIIQFVRQNISQGFWKNLREFYRNYAEIISPAATEYLLESLSSKNSLILSILPDITRYKLFYQEYKFAISSDFYALQSDIDAHYFNDEILEINNTISDYQKTDSVSKAALGRIFIAMVNFEAYTENLANILKSNSVIGAKWASNEKNFLAKFVENTNKSSEKDYGNTAEWVILSIFYILLFIGLAKIASWDYLYLAIGIPVEAVIYIFVNKYLNKNFEKESSSGNDTSFRRKLKKFTFKLVILQFYVMVILLAISVVIAAIGIAISTGGGGLVVIIILIIRYLRRKKGK